MLIPAVASRVSQFYAVGNTPAVTLTRDLPQGQDASILLLGCGDVRNILYTSHVNSGLPPRKLDFTCCDVETAVIARNAVLFSLIIDQDQNVDPSTLWDIYYDTYLQERTAKLLQSHLETLLSVSETLQAWRESNYGSVLSFCDEGTLRLVRANWTKCLAAAQSVSKSAFDAELKRTREISMGGGHATVLTGLRSAAPYASADIMEASKSHGHFWEHGSLTRTDANVPNPLIAGIITANTLLHYGTDPLLGFHLAAGLADLAPDSPLAIDGQISGLERLVATALLQFKQWVAAFRGQIDHGLRVRFMVADALTFCRVLQDAGTSQATASMFYRRQFDISPCVLDPHEYRKPGGAPYVFDVVDTSNLSDHLGALNLIVSASPLLRDTVTSTLYLESLIRKSADRHAELDNLLCGHAPTVSLILGVSAVEYWTNATMVSPVNEMMMQALQASKGDQATQLHTRSSWKRNGIPRGQSVANQALHIPPKPLAKAFAEIYFQMFQYEKSSIGLKMMNPEVLRNSAYPQFHRGNLVSLMRNAQSVVQSDWPEVYRSLIGIICSDRTLVLGTLYLQELCLGLHMQSLYTESSLKDDIRKDPSAGTFNAWNTIPVAIAVTLVVPRSNWEKIYAADPTKKCAPTFQIGVSSDYFLNVFAGLHLAFGKVKTTGSPTSDDFSVSIEEDPEGWSGSSPAVVSFFMPAAALQDSATIDLRVQATPQAMLVYGKAGLGHELVVYSTTTKDVSHVLVTRNMPGLGEFRTRPQPPKEQEGPVNLTATVGETTGRVTSLTGHLDVTTEEGKKLLTDKVPITLQQTWPYSIDVVFGESQLVCPIPFPLPVSETTARTRIARKSAYVEVIAQLADPLESDVMSGFVYPTLPGPEGVPVNLNGQHINLDSMPILNVEPEHKKNNGWLTTLASHQFSARERRMREGRDTETGMTANARLNFKESVFTLFMIASGLQGGQTGLFSLHHATAGNVMLLFVRCLRLDGAAGTVVADMAALPLTRALVDSGELGDFLLVLRELQIGAVQVDDAELRLWQRAVPALAERCRAWAHGPACEYRRPGAAVPLGLDPGARFLCRCGLGALPAGYTSLPEWDRAAPHAVRLALSPTFAVPFVESLTDQDPAGLAGAMQTMGLDRCRHCAAPQTPAGGKLLKCTRCKEAAYCSRECQKADWKKHRMECA